MPDDCGVARPDDPEDWQDFMLGVFDLIATARDLQANEEAVDLLDEARQLLIAEFQRKFPGYGAAVVPSGETVRFRPIADVSVCRTTAPWTWTSSHCSAWSGSPTELKTATDLALG